MLHQDFGNSHIDEDQAQESPFFNEIFLSLVKTFVMVTGEIEFGDFPLEKSTDSYFPYTFLLVFVFLIVVVLMNLLNGLAVSDVGEIKEQAEIITHTGLVETVCAADSYYKFFLDPKDFVEDNRRGKSHTSRLKLTEISFLSVIYHLLSFAFKIENLPRLQCLFNRGEKEQHQISPSTRMNGNVMEHNPKKRWRIFKTRFIRDIFNVFFSELPRDITKDAIKTLISKREAMRAEHTDQSDIMEMNERLKKDLEKANMKIEILQANLQQQNQEIIQLLKDMNSKRQ